LPKRFEQKHQCSYVPFGFGARACLGIEMAKFEMVAVVAMLLQKYRFEMAADHPKMETAMRLTIYPKNPLWVQVYKRTEH